MNPLQSPNTGVDGESHRDRIINNTDKIKAKIIEVLPISKRDEIVPLYAELIMLAHLTGDFEVKEVNQAIIEKWSYSAMDYILNNAWKIVEA